jgi:ubiquinone/menaquinone biosynthesis C-methylase UbiE
MSFENPTAFEKIAFRVEWSLSSPLIATYLRRLGIEGGETLLEIGCGGGAVTRKLAGLLPDGHVVGIDPSAYWVAYARRRLDDCRNVTLHVGDVLTENLASEAFDAALFHFVLHEIDSGDRPSTLSRAYDLLKEGGRLFLREPTKAGHGISVGETRSLLESVGFREERGEMRRKLLLGRTFEGIFQKI